MGLNTVAGYRSWVGHALRGSVAAMPLDRIGPLDLERLYEYLASTPAGRSRLLSAVSVRHVAAVLANAFADAQRHKLITDNPAVHAKRPRGQSPRVAAPTLEQVSALLEDLGRHNPALLDLAIA
ncbi:MAG: hypothetical protein J2P47_06880 [Acetobacteraceae bacterium]|nr:hypothetical protein [Acetobacteraceae bacterium]